jgi:hypothetical protein
MGNGDGKLLGTGNLRRFTNRRFSRRLSFGATFYRTPQAGPQGSPGRGLRGRPSRASGRSWNQTTLSWMPGSDLREILRGNRFSGANVPLAHHVQG